MLTPLEIAARIHRPTLWNPEGIPVLRAELRTDGVLVILTGPEKHKLGAPRRLKKVYVVRTHRPDPVRGDAWACDGFVPEKNRVAAEVLFRETVDRSTSHGPADLLPGARVRCEYRGDHEGTVLADDDPRVWAGTIAFPDPEPDPDAVRAHVAKHADLFRKDVRRPVLWDFGKVYWDSNLSPVGKEG